MNEYIIAACNWYKDLPLMYDGIPKEQYLPKGCNQGVTFSGQRHLHCLRTMNVLTGKKQHEAGEEIQGFLTNKNRFVDRTEAMSIAINAKQIIEGKYSNTELYSEDLW